MNVFQQIFPTLSAGLSGLQSGLVSVAMLLALAGMLERVYASNGEYERIGWILCRLVIVAFLIVNISTIITAITNIATGVATSAGFSVTSNMWHDYLSAITTKFNAPQGGNNWNWMFHTGDAIGASVFGAIAYSFSILGWVVMTIMLALQSLLLQLEITFAPVFIGALMIRPVVNLFIMWATTLVALSLWVVGFAVVDLAMKWALDIALNTSTNALVSGANGILQAIPGGTVAASIIFFFVAAGIAIFGYPAAAGLISVAIVTRGGHGIGNLTRFLFGVGVGAAANSMWGVRQVSRINNQINSLPPGSAMASPQTNHIRPGFNTSSGSTQASPGQTAGT